VSTGSRLQVTVISAEHIDHLPDVPIVSRTSLLIPPAEDKPIAYLETLSLNSDFWTAGWRGELFRCLTDTAEQGQVGYLVPGHPMLGDATMQFLLESDSQGMVDLELYDEPLPVLLTEILSFPGGPPTFVDGLTLLELSRLNPFHAGMLPVSSMQSVVVTNVTPHANGSEVADILQRCYRAETIVRLVPMLGEPEQVELPLSELNSEESLRPCYLVIPAVRDDEFQRTVQDVQRLVARLRAPGGCPWDREQSNLSLSRNLIEESYELLDAIQSGDYKAMCEELGDFLLQAILHSQIAEESGEFTLGDVTQSLVDKLVRRHPHVFDKAEAENATAVVLTWDEIKRAERAARPATATESPLGDIPASLPALMRAQSMVKRAGRTVLSNDELERLSQTALSTFESETERATLSRVLEIVQYGQEHDIDLEQSLRRWTQEFEATLSKSTEPDAGKR
jgi:tetrapyrrole methylase family protein / MazG family protein